MADQTVPGSGGGTPPTLFLRQATGLVREMNTWDAFNIDLTNANGWANVAILLPLGLAFFAGINFGLSVFLGLLAGMSVVLVYTMLAHAMPRSGGDYVFISRVLHPFVGFLGSWSMMVVCAFFSAFNAFSLGNWILPDFFSVMGFVTNSPALYDWATFVAKPWVTVVIELISFALYFLIMFSGAKFAAVTQWLPTIFTVGALVIGLPVLLFVSPETYQANFASFAAHWHTSAAAMETLATKGGANLNPQFSLGATIGFWPFVMVIFGYALNSIMIGGEMRNPRRAQYISVVGSTLLAGGIYGVFLVLGVTRIPSQLMGAMGYLSYVNPAQSPFPFALYAHVPMSLAWENPIWVIFLHGAVGFGIWFASVGLYFWGTRYMFAWSIDRMAPPQFGKLAGARNAPVVAIGVMTVLTVIFGLALELVPGFTYIVGALLQAFPLLLTSVAAIFFPYRMPDLYRGSIKLEVAGIPVISILGVIATVFMLLMIFFYATNSTFGAFTTGSVIFSGLVIVSGVIWYAVAWTVNRRHGFDVNLTYREVPPE